MSKLGNRAKAVGLGIYSYLRSLRAVISGNSYAGEKLLVTWLSSVLMIYVFSDQSTK